MMRANYVPLVLLKPACFSYDHTVHYDDGTSHTYTTLERPNLFGDFSDSGQVWICCRRR